MSRFFASGTFAGHCADDEYPASTFTLLLTRMGEPALRAPILGPRRALRFLCVPTHWPPFCVRAEWVAGEEGMVVARTTDGRGGYLHRISRVAVDRKRVLSIEECRGLDQCLERLAPWDRPAVAASPPEVDDGTWWLVEWRHEGRSGVLLREEPEEDEGPPGDDGRCLIEPVRALFWLGGLAVTTLGEARERGGDDEGARRDLLNGERVVVFPGSPFLPEKMSLFGPPR